MSESKRSAVVRLHRSGIKGDAYKHMQRVRAFPLLLADSRVISAQGLMLRRTPNGTMFARPMKRVPAAAQVVNEMAARQS